MKQQEAKSQSIRRSTVSRIVRTTFIVRFIVSIAVFIPGCCLNDNGAGDQAEEVIEPAIEEPIRPLGDDELAKLVSWLAGENYDEVTTAQPESTPAKADEIHDTTHLADPALSELWQNVATGDGSEP